MIETIQQTNYLLALGGIFFALITALLCIDLRTSQKLKPFIRTWGLVVAFIITTASVILTLIYSEIFGIIPCGLCWIERISLYPQILLLVVALRSKDALVARYGITLATFGLMVALYHHYIQMGGAQFIKCPAAGAGADCAKRFLFEFNFITFPLLAAGLFAFQIVLYFYILKANKH